MSWKQNRGLDTEQSNKYQNVFVGYVDRRDRNKGRTFKKGSAKAYEEDLGGSGSAASVSRPRTSMQRQAVSSDSWSPEWGVKVVAPTHYIGYVPKRERKAQVRKQTARDPMTPSRGVTRSGHRPDNKPLWRGANAPDVRPLTGSSQIARRLNTCEGRLRGSFHKPVTVCSGATGVGPMQLAVSGMSLDSDPASTITTHKVKGAQASKVFTRTRLRTASRPRIPSDMDDSAAAEALEASDILIVQHTPAPESEGYTEELFGHLRPKTPNTAVCGRAIMQAWAQTS